jgi:hypothetical protein
VASLWEIGYPIRERSHHGRIRIECNRPNGEEDTDMARLNADEKNRIAAVLDSTFFRNHGFTVEYDGENNTMAIIAFSSSPECQFIINSTDNDAFTTQECPGVHSDAAETVQRNNFDLCLHAIKDWVERSIDRQEDWILDEFGGAADRNPF